jgi:secreted protein with Ig-like and vWFA domain
MVRSFNMKPYTQTYTTTTPQQHPNNTQQHPNNTKQHPNNTPTTPRQHPNDTPTTPQQHPNNTPTELDTVNKFAAGRARQGGVIPR